VGIFGNLAMDGTTQFLGFDLDQRSHKYLQRFPPLKNSGIVGRNIEGFFSRLDGFCFGRDDEISCQSARNKRVWPDTHEIEIYPVEPGLLTNAEAVSGMQGSGKGGLGSWSFQALLGRGLTRPPRDHHPT